MLPATYILRLYGTVIAPTAHLVGTVETPGGSHSATFTNLPELVAILEAPDQHLREPAQSPVTDSFSIRLYRQDSWDG